VPVWGQLGLQERISVNFSLLTHLHDYLLRFLVVILTFVFYLMLIILLAPFPSKRSIDSHLLETV